MLPKPVNITPEQTRRFRSIMDRQTAIQQWVKAVTDQAESRLAELQTQSRELWQELQAEHALDLNHVAYTISDDGTQIVPRQVQL